MDTNKPLMQMTDEEILNQVIPAYARALNWVYERTVAPLERMIDHLRGSSTRHMIADFEANEERLAKRTATHSISA